MGVPLIQSRLREPKHSDVRHDCQAGPVQQAQDPPLSYRASFASSQHGPPSCTGANQGGGRNKCLHVCNTCTPSVSVTAPRTPSATIDYYTIQPTPLNTTVSSGAYSPLNLPTKKICNFY
eukprot:1137647-Pelagomonas_calceolata.AAC.2